ncbi:2-polyprenyl-6-methoxyphenol hydroxylase [Enhydrobacter aerosaccus]|uniref:2-polyprenyl-6-methoxyphenol hydroxylase n=1 Tax=Enhydrobacter aerosaccus TaxID=225324 RepID=A0A1T4SFQ3_9HYPH|nr:FAD-dependent monooxygenase [Enhydrobacter aerosaccus]SKA27027.1 2-polyprenyl-6-methoxyphenol hydroxylase [Enhydrobacter aerosaccus]
MTTEPSADVLIAGAGPTGLSLAITLRQYGIPVRIVDRAAAPSSVSKALALWSASLEALQALGVVEHFVADGQRLNALCIGDGGRRLATLAVGEGIDSPFPFPLLLPQSRTEQLLTARLAELGVTVERSVELAGLTQDGQGVTATLTHADGRKETATAKYVVGCDGARSAVRQALGITFEGYTEPQTFLLGDVLIDGGDLDHRSIYLWWHNGGTVALFPFETATWRVFAMRADDPSNGSEPTSLEELQRAIDDHGPHGLRLRDPSWLSVFRINERLAAQYRVDRCFLAGDAAHIHSPAGGQGMNTGIQDAVNLGWKLAYVLKGVGNAALLLDSYEAERRPVAKAVVDAAAQKLHLAFGGNKLMTLAKDMAVSIFGNMPAVQRKLQVELSETEIIYRDGPLVALGGGKRKAKRTDVGSRAREATIVEAASGKSHGLWPYLSTGHHSLLIFEEGERPLTAPGIVNEAAQQLQVLRLDGRSDPKGEVRERYRLRGPGWVLVRPDQVVAARGEGDDFSVLQAYAAQVLHPS